MGLIIILFILAIIFAGSMELANKSVIGKILTKSECDAISESLKTENYHYFVGILSVMGKPGFITKIPGGSLFCKYYYHNVGQIPRSHPLTKQIDAKMLEERLKDFNKTFNVK